MIDITLILCCYNGRGRLRSTIEHLVIQKVGASLSWEFVFVDNNSSDGSADYVQSLWEKSGNDVPLRIVKETRPGLVYARIAGVNAAKGKYIIFCDDDNWLREDYLQTAYELMEAMPNVGVSGGQSLLAPGVEAPEWWEKQQGNFAVGKQLEYTGIANERGFLYGAGMVTRTELARRIFDERYPFLLTGRKGDQLLSGEDGEYCWRVMMLGYDLYYSEALFYWHDVDPKRLNNEQLAKLLKSFEAGYTICEKYQYAIKYQQSSTIIHIAWFFVRVWNYLAASKRRKVRKQQLLHMHAYMLGIGKEDSEMSVIKEYMLSLRQK